jgi:cobalt-zinc-cadmium efflux system membrane fusion protein
MNLRRLFALAFALQCCAAPLRAQDRLDLDAATITRLGLVFAAVNAPDSGDGARFPARVGGSPMEASELHAVHGGVLESWFVQPGGVVESGAVLATLRSATALALQQQYVAAEAAARQSDFALDRDRNLFEQGVIAEQRLRETERIAREAAFNVQAAEASLLQAGLPADELPALREQGAALGVYRIRAPFAGRITHIDHVVGDMVEEGEVVASITGQRQWIAAELPATLAARVAVGQTLQLADTGATLVVQMKDEALDAQTQTVGVHAEFTEAVDLLQGQIVTLLLPPLVNGVVVPAEAVVRSGRKTLVYVRSASGVEVRSPSLQPLGGAYLATDGLQAGDEVVVRGASILKGITLGLGGE